jgi:hypothetical protein
LRMTAAPRWVRKVTSTSMGPAGIAKLRKLYREHRQGHTTPGHQKKNIETTWASSAASKAKVTGT